MNREAYERYIYYWTSNGNGEMICRLADYSIKNDGNSWMGETILEVICDDGDLSPPDKIRAEYERLIEWSPGDSTGCAANLVEIIDGDSGFNQKCKFGNLVEEHAVYCHNHTWLYSPRKCRRSWYTRGQTKDEDCEGYQPNEKIVMPPKPGETEA